MEIIFLEMLCSNRKPLNDIEVHYVIQTIKNEIKRGKALGLYVAHDENFPVTFSAMDKMYQMFRLQIGMREELMM